MGELASVGAGVGQAEEKTRRGREKEAGTQFSHHLPQEGQQRPDQKSSGRRGLATILLT